MSPVTTIPSPSSAMKKNGHERASFGDIPSKKDTNTSFGNNCLKGSYNDFECRSFLDKGGKYKKGYEGPHVDAKYKDHPTYDKCRFFLDGSPKTYKPKGK